MAATTGQITYTIAEAAASLGRDERFVAESIARGELVPTEGGRLTRESLMALLAQQDQATAALAELSQAALDNGWYDITPEHLRAPGIITPIRRPARWGFAAPGEVRPR